MVTAQSFQNPSNTIDLVGPIKDSLKGGWMTGLYQGHPVKAEVLTSADVVYRGPKGPMGLQKDHMNIRILIWYIIV